jgi:hypothetical protein
VSAPILLGIVGVWLVLQATSGRLGARVLSLRDNAGPGSLGGIAGSAGGAAAAAAPTSSAPAVAVDGGAGAPKLATWGGFTMRADVLPRARMMFEAAARDGIRLTVNSSYRPVSEQIEIRRRNCGPSHYDIYQKPSGQCSPPTAIPGQSNHQRGLALDINVGTRSSPEFRWLAANAARYGFYNLPSEAWHWSTDAN